MKITKIREILPGFIIAVMIAGVARFLEGLLPIHLIGSSVIALFIGMILNSFWRPDILKSGLKFTSKKVLKIAIILLGASLSIQTILTVGRMSLTVMVFTLLTCFGGGYFIGKALGLKMNITIYEMDIDHSDQKDTQRNHAVLSVGLPKKMLHTYALAEVSKIENICSVEEA